MNFKGSNKHLPFVVVAIMIISSVISDGDCVFYGHIYPHNIVWTRELILEQGFSVKWITKDKNWLKMRISAPTNGYISIGFSPYGEMNGSDIVMGWMDDKGDPHLQDMYAVGNKTPLKDRMNNYELLWAEETYKNTTIIFQRRWKTCDSQQDFEIPEGAVKLIWAYGENDPVLAEDKSFTVEYHEDDFRRGKSVFLKTGGSTHFPNASNKVKHWNFTLGKDTMIGDEEIINYCKIFKTPPTKRKHQIIGFRPLIEEKNKQWVYRIKLWECTVATDNNNTSENIFQKYLRRPGEYCHSNNMPPEWGQHCTTYLFSWAIGSEGLMQPKNVGIPFDENNNDGRTYFMLEVHYNNPDHLEIKDSSGVRMFLTDDIRDNDGGTISIYTSKIGKFHFLPPKTPQFKNMAFCTSECTEQTLPPNGITVTHVNFHVHSATRKIMLRHIRDGKELSPISQDSYYDPNYQQIRLVDPPRKVLPGDEIIIECEYDTMGQENVTYGEINSRDEVCQANIHYYPRANLSSCRNQYEFHNFFSSLGIKEVAGDPSIPTFDLYDSGDDAYIISNTSYGLSNFPFELMNVVESDFYKNITVKEYMNRLRWNDNDKDNVNQIAKQLWYGKHYAFCSGSSLQKIPLKEKIVSYPSYVPFIKPVLYDCPLETSGSIKISTRMILVIICNVILIEKYFY